MPRLTPEQRLAKAREELSRAQAEIKELNRKNETRRKIVLGAMLLADAETQPNIANYVRKLIERLDRPADKAAFQDWEPKLAPPKS